jgi:hypothetical protein
LESQSAHVEFSGSLLNSLIVAIFDCYYDVYNDQLRPPLFRCCPIDTTPDAMRWEEDGAIEGGKAKIKHTNFRRKEVVAAVSYRIDE